MRKKCCKRFFNKILFFCFCIASVTFTSCSNEDGGGDILEGRPEDQVDDSHVKVENRYGITAICEKGSWKNQYSDTMPDASRNYYEEVLHNRVDLAYLPDMITDSLSGNESFPTVVYLMRFFYEPEKEEQAMDFMNKYRYIAFVMLEGAYYSEVSPLESTMLNGYEAQHFTVKMMDGVVKDGVQEYYLIYHQGRIYCAAYSVNAFSSENAKEICEKILNTVKVGVE
jgi:hypothetical protein